MQFYLIAKWWENKGLGIYQFDCPYSMGEEQAGECLEQSSVESCSENGCPVVQITPADVWASVQHVDLRVADSGREGSCRGRFAEVNQRGGAGEGEGNAFAKGEAQSDC